MIRQHRHRRQQARAVHAGWLGLPLLLAICQTLALVHALSHLHVAPLGATPAFVAQVDVDHDIDVHAECRLCVEFGQIASFLPSSAHVPGVVPQDALRFVAAAAPSVALEPRRCFLARAPPKRS